jgi:hypothetical protein
VPRQDLGFGRLPENRVMTQFMVIESFLPGCKEKIYERFHKNGRMLPDGLAYIDSWLEKNGNRCFQLMRTNDPSLFQVWQENWKDLVSFEIIEIGGKPTQKKPERRSIKCINDTG